MRRANRILGLVGIAGLGVMLWLMRTESMDTRVRTERVGALAAEEPPSEVPANSYASADDSVDGSLAFPVMQATTPAEVRTVTRFCNKAGPGDIAALRHAATKSDDPLVVGNALRALGRLGAFAGDAELEALLADERQRVRQEAVIALGYSGSAGAVERLVPLAEERDPMLRPLVLQALGRLGGEQARAVLKSVLSDASSSEAERALAREGLARG
jgi:HEAT repeat protein